MCVCVCLYKRGGDRERVSVCDDGEDRKRCVGGETDRDGGGGGRKYWSTLRLQSRSVTVFARLFLMLKKLACF